MAGRICPKCKTRPLAKHRRYCDECRDGIEVPRAASVAPPASRVAVISALQTVPARTVVLSCGHTTESSTLWQEQNTNCSKHGTVWVTRIAR